VSNMTEGKIVRFHSCKGFSQHEFSPLLLQALVDANVKRKKLLADKLGISPETLRYKIRQMRESV